jgi:hypothetical protein
MTRGKTNTLVDIYHKIDAIEPDEYGCKVWPGRHGVGGRIEVSVGKKRYWVARLVLERKLGRAIRPGFFALHKCDLPPCMNEEHIYEGTHSDNRRDLWERNLEFAKPRREHLRELFKTMNRTKRTKRMRDKYDKQRQEVAERGRWIEAALAKQNEG